MRWRTTMILLLAMALAVAPTAGAQSRPDLPDDRGESRRCDAMSVEGRGGTAVEIRTFAPITAISNPRRFGANAALWASVRGLRCRAFMGLMADVLLADDELAALGLAGWKVTQIDRLRIDGVPLHQTWAVKEGRRILFVRRGAHPPVSLSVYRAAQNVAFERTEADAYGRGSGCTAAYVLRLANGALVGLTAGHCSSYPFFSPSGLFETESAIRFRRKVPSFEITKEPLGSVIANPERAGEGPDALIFGFGEVPLAAQQLERGYRSRLTPHRVVGWLPTRRQRRGLLICYSGRSSGSDNCGRVYDRVGTGAHRLICAHVRTRGGDSGGPVYTRPRRGEVRAVGIVTASRVFVGAGDLCYTPIQPILESFGATLPVGSFRTAFDPGLGGP